MDKTLKIGTRDSALALAQAEILLGWLKRNRPGCPAELVPMKSTGDRRLDMPLYTGEARGIFTGELEAALLDGRIDLAVHSLKDMGAADDPRLPIVAYLKRADPRDALLLGRDGSLRRVGTSSKRRRYQLAALAPEAAAVPVRGNLATRFRKLEEGEYSALILAAAGLTRLGETGRISRYFSMDEMIPACGQGILAVQARADFDRSLLEGLEDRDAADAARAERAFAAAMGGGCSQPVGGYAELLGDRLRLRGYWYDEETGQARRGELEGSRELAAAVGKALARRLQRRTPGKVWLVGAGPGDEGLLTVKGRELLRRADAVVYDRLVGPGLLSLPPAGAELLDVGKRAGRHPVPQDEINALLLDRALDGREVVRLKGGDPFLFGRGGEEALALAALAVPFEVVPGVTSALAVPAYAGIPVTHRGVTSAVHIVTARGKHGESPDYAALAALKNCTLVFLMGRAEAPGICAGLLAAGLPGSTPAAAVENGTMAGQRAVFAPLSKLAERMDEAAIGSPCIITVGETAALAASLRWAEKRPLHGRRIIVTRPAGDSALAERLALLGAQVVSLPAFGVRLLDIREELASLPLDKPLWLLFSSRHAVEAFFENLPAGGRDLRAFSSAKFAAVGRATAAALEARGIAPDRVPAVYSGRALADETVVSLEEGERAVVFAPKGETGECAARLQELGVPFLRVEAYETEPVAGGAPPLQPGDLAVFASASAVRAFLARTAGQDLSGVTAACIGETTRAAAVGFGRTLVARQASIDSLVDCILEEARRAPPSE